MISGPEATGNVVGADLIGAGFYASPLANGGDGVLINDGASDNWIGVNSVYAPDTAADGNLIGNNGAAGVEISGTSTNSNVVAGNTLNSNGTDGVKIDNGASGNWIGVNPVDGSEALLRRNVISGNTNDGVEITGTGTTGNVVAGDYIGTDPTGTQAVPNYAGVEIDSGATGNLIGTNGDGVNDALERNIISGNLFAGVWITGTGTDDNVVAGNYIGTDVTGTIAVGNGSAVKYRLRCYAQIAGDVVINAGASDNLIGTTGQSADDAGERNVISGSGSDGVDIGERDRRQRCRG